MSRADDTGTPLVSVVIPCFNQGQFLAEAIASVLGQTYQHYEILVVDDGSTDQTAKVAADSSRVRYLYQTNRGLAAARNTGWRASQGAYLVFLDADDRLLPQALEAGVRCLQAAPEAAFGAGHFRYLHADGTVRHEDIQESRTADPYAAFLHGNYLAMHATVMYRRQALAAVGGFRDCLRACEDYDLYLRLSRVALVVRHTGLVAEYRQHPGNMSRDPGLMLPAALAVLRAQWRWAKATTVYRQAYKAGIQGWQAYYGEKLLAQAVSRLACGEPQLAVRSLWTLLRYAPRYLARQSCRRGVTLAKRLGRAVCPAWIRHAWRRWRTAAYLPAVGKVRFGDLRRLAPLSREFGYDRGRPVDRYYIEHFLALHQQDISGRVLEVGDNTYTCRFGGARVTRSDVLHVTAGNPLATFVADLARAEHLPSQAFDCIILTQTLHLIYDLRAAVRTLYRILKPGGVLLATVPGISQVSIDEWSDSWYWALTRRAALQVLAESFPPEACRVIAYGNVLAATAFLYGLAAEELRQDELEYPDPHYQLLLTMRAVRDCPGTDTQAGAVG